MTLFASGGPWLISKRTDLWIFGAPFLLSLAFLAFGSWNGLLHRPLSAPFYVISVLLVDVAHVWSTIFRVYLDRQEFQKRKLLYLGAPLLLLLLSIVVYAISPRLFWTILAYAATFHFIRQQVGWVKLYHRHTDLTKRAQRFERTLDIGTTYTVTLWPVLYWHAHLPRDIDWLIENDYVPFQHATSIATIGAVVYVAVLLLWLVDQMRRIRAGRFIPGATLVIGSTAVLWFVGIVAMDSDFAFTVTNVFAHGIPYLAVISLGYVERMRSRLRPIVAWSAVVFGSAFLAFIEEGVWDRLVWNDHAAVFAPLLGGPIAIAEASLVLLVPLLSLPQTTHYLLDAIIWRRKNM